MADEEALKLTRSLKWLEDRRRDIEVERTGLYWSAWSFSSGSPETARFRYREFGIQLQQFDTLIAQHKKRLADYRRQERLERERRRIAASDDAEPVCYAVPRPDVLSVKKVERLPAYAEHLLADQIAHRARTLEAWNYRCLGARHRRPSRRYEGLQMGGR